MTREYETAVRREASRVGPGLTPIGGAQAHLGLTLSESFLQGLMSEVSSALPPIETRITVGGSRPGLRAAVEISAEAVLSDIELVAPQINGVLLRFTLNTRVAVRRPGSRSDHFLPGAVESGGILELGRDEAGQTVLRLRVVGIDDPENPDHLRARIALHALDPEVAEAVLAFVEPGIERLLLQDTEPVVLLHFPDLSLGAVRVALAPAGLVMNLDERAVFAGFVTNLRPLYRSQLSRRATVVDGGVSYIVHPGLPAAATRLGLVEGGLESRYDESLSPDPDGAIHVTVADASFEATGYQLAFRIWDLRGGVCQTADVAVAGPILLLDSAVGLSLNEAAVIGVGPDGLDLEAWLGSKFISASELLAEQLVDLRGVTLGSGQLLQLVPTDLNLGEDRFEVLYGRSDASRELSPGIPSD